MLMKVSESVVNESQVNESVALLFVLSVSIICIKCSFIM